MTHIFAAPSPRLIVHQLNVELLIVGLPLNLLNGFLDKILATWLPSVAPQIDNVLDHESDATRRFQRLFVLDLVQTLEVIAQVLNFRCK